MSVFTYSLRKDGNKTVGRFFKVKEFRCKDGSDKILISPETVTVLEAVRNWFGKPVYIHSAYRTPKHNAKVGGAKSSQHVKGTAVDFHVSGVPTSAVVSYIEKFYPYYGVGFYSTFVHVDSRGYKVYWKDRGSNVVKSFYKGNEYLNYKQQPAQSNNVNTTKTKEEEMTQAEFNQMMNVYLSELASEPANAEWSKDGINWVVENGLIKGDQHGNLKMHSFVTREQLATILNRYDNLNTELNTSPSEWSLEARTWAVDNKLVQGDGNKMSWESLVTKEQIATILYRFKNL